MYWILNGLPELNFVNSFIVKVQAITESGKNGSKERIPDVPVSNMANCRDKLLQYQ